MTAREEVLDRIHRALRDVPTTETPESVPVVRDYRHASIESHEHLIEQLIDRLVDYKAAVRRVAAAELPAAIAGACHARGVRRLAVPADLPSGWLPQGVEVVPDDGLSHEQLDAVDGVLTGCALAIAQTGTIVLDGGEGQGRRALTLLPDYHLCVVRSDQVVGLVPEAVSRLAPTSTRPMTWISGPSATSDIELNRVEGVHGPRTLEVLIVS
ncbi:MAG TPA: LUD domain-containing protein [Isosphaeraceae bacterium]|jgi:L-lactate dehydrogenase complex protein LldG